jgi:hypothetical protein
VSILEVLGKTRVENGESVPKWPWVDAGSR